MSWLYVIANVCARILCLLFNYTGFFHRIDAHDRGSNSCILENVRCSMYMNWGCLLMLKVVLNLRNPMHLSLSATLDVLPSCVQSPVVADLGFLATRTYNHC